MDHYVDWLPGLYLPQPGRKQNINKFCPPLLSLDMAAQPDFKRLSEAFTTASTVFDTASHEIAHIPNVPIFNDGQRLFEAINSLTTTVESLKTNIEAKFTTIEAKVTTLETRFTALETRFTALETTIDRRFGKLEDRISAE